jgi:hypothetical protein
LELSAQHYCQQAIFAIETETSEAHLHIQGTFSSTWDIIRAAITALRRHLRHALNMEPGDGAKIVIKPFEGHQTLPEVVG